MIFSAPGSGRGGIFRGAEHDVVARLVTAAAAVRCFVARHLGGGIRNGDEVAGVEGPEERFQAGQTDEDEGDLHTGFG